MKSNTPPDWVTDMGALPKHAFFEKVIGEGVGLTYADVKLASRHSAGSATGADVRSRFSRRVPMNMPISSSAMDTVTESRMAIALALAGGIGVIHKNLSPDQQAREVAKVKHHVHGLIRTPITVSPDDKVSDILEMCEEKGYRFRTFPVVSEGNTLLGLVTSQDFGSGFGPDLRIKEIMTAEVVTVPQGIGPEQALADMRLKKKKVLPMVQDGGLLVGLYLRSDLERVVNRNSEANLDSNGQLYVAAAIGVGKDAMDRARLLVEAGVNALVIDTAHGDTPIMVETIGLIKSRWPDVDVVAGNVSEPDSAWRLANAGADAIKVGQGPGSICTTRKVAGIGNPQVTAIFACAQAVRDFPGTCIIADGGITASGDVVVALAAGAHSVMLGRVLAGSDESPGEEQIIKGVPHRSYRGMGSLAAMRTSEESRARYGQSGVSGNKLVAEGVEAMIPSTGPVAAELARFLGGLRSGMGYTGSPDIPMLQEMARFRRLTPGAVQESTAHSLSHVIG